MNHYDLKPFDSDSALAKAAARDFVALIDQAGKEGPFLVGLSGGRITKQFFNFTVEEIKSRGTSIGMLHFFWADERCVPPDHPDSNFVLANDHLFKPLGIATANLHRLRGELPQSDAVVHAIAEFRQIAGPKKHLDIVLLGMGEDGHIASLFPNATKETIECAAPFLSINNSPKPPPDRLSLSFAALKAAREVWVLASGNGKENALRLSLKPGTPETPLGRLLQMRERTTVYTELKV